MIKRIRSIFNSKGKYTARGLEGRLIAEEDIGILFDKLISLGYSKMDARQLMSDVIETPIETFFQVNDAIADRPIIDPE